MADATGPSQQDLAFLLTQHRAGQWQEAEAGYRRILALNPHQADCRHLLGVLAHQQGRHAEAVTHITAALRQKPNCAAWLSNLGEAYRAFEQPALAEASFRHAIALDPGDPAAPHNLARLLRDTGQMDAALALCRGLLQQHPFYAEAWLCLGTILLPLHRIEDAAAAFRRATELRPDYHAALANLAAAEERLDRPEQAVEICRKILAQDPHHPEALINLGTSLHRIGRPLAALTPLRHALTVQPDSIQAHFNFSLAALATGRWPEAWNQYEWRRHLPGQNWVFPVPEWQGEALKNRRLIIYAEQGMGDTLQFCRLLDRLPPEASVTMMVPPGLVRLLQRLHRPAEIQAMSAPPPQADFACALLSLPRRLGLTPDHLPGRIPYLAASPERIAFWQARLGDRPGLRVGLCWAGNTDLPADHRRSLLPRQLAPLAAIQGITWVSLQKPAGGIPGLDLLDWTAELDDFAETAALITALDLVISVDTAIAHLAGALGKPIWLLNRFDACWRWLQHRDDSPWYPSLRQFQQPAPGDWASVFAWLVPALVEAAQGLKPRRLSRPLPPML